MKPHLPPADLATLNAHLQSTLATLGAATNQVPAHLIPNFLASIALSAASLLSDLKQQPALEALLSQVARLSEGRGIGPEILQRGTVRPDPIAGAHRQ